MKLSLMLLTAGALLLAAGCTTAVQSGTNTALEGDDLLRMTDDMAAKIAAAQSVQEAIQREGPLSIVVQPVENHMTAEILPRGPAEAFTARVRTLLSKHAPESFVWVMNRDAFYHLRDKELDLGPPPERVQPHYALAARFYTLTQEDPTHRSSAYLCVYDLSDLRNGKSLWTDKYELRKTAVKGFLD